MTTPRFTFQICSWRAPESLKVTLRSIAIQPHAHLFETLLVNNGFSDEKAALLLKEFPAINLRIIQEPKPGVAYARLAGFKEARGEVIVLLDDDTSLEENFVSELVKVLDAYPHFGGICPLILPKWEITPPAWVQDIGPMCLSYTVKNKSESPPESYWPHETFNQAPRPPGGGMIIHRVVLEYCLSQAYDSLRNSPDRVGTKLASCQDCEIYEQIQFTDRGSLQTPRLIVYHHIPSFRCKLGYLLRLNYQISHFYIQLIDKMANQRLGFFRESVNLIKSLTKYTFLAVSGQKAIPYCLCIMARRAGSFTARVSLAG